MHTPTFSLQPGNLSPYYVESAAVACFDNFLLKEPYLKDKIPALSQIPTHVDYQQFHVSPPQVALTSFGKTGLLKPHSTFKFFLEKSNSMGAITRFVLGLQYCNAKSPCM